MSTDKEERLRQLQMADLGSGRREYISTVDDSKKQSRVQLKELEAMRASNIAGTKTAQDAKKDQAELNAWANLHKTIGDTRGLENLDDLMSGQSHRAHLNAAIQAAGGQRYTSDPPKGHTKAKGHHPIPAASSGRGGGVVGTRGRGSSMPPAKAMKFDRRAVTQRHEMPPLQRLDPALDINNLDSSPQHGRGSPRGRGKRRREEAPVPVRGKKEIPPVQVKRPMIDFSRNISTPEAFMAIARQTFRTGSAAPNTPSPASSAPTSVVGQQPERPNIFGQIKPKILIPPGLGPSPTPKVTETPGNKRPIPKTPGPSAPESTITPVNKRPDSQAPPRSTPEVTAMPVSRHPLPQAPPRSTPSVTETPVSGRAVSKAPTPSAPQAADTPVNKRPASNAPETPMHPARVPRATPISSGPAPASQRTPAEARTGEAHAVPARSPAPHPAIEPQVATESTPGTNLQKSNDDVGKNISAALLLDVDAPADVSNPELQSQIMSPSCAELTGLDFRSAESSRVVSSPSTSLARSETQSAAENYVRSELLSSGRQLTQSTRLAQQLIDTAKDTRDRLLNNFITALLAGSTEAQELAVAVASTPQRSTTGMSHVEDWLLRAPADQALSPDQTAPEVAKSSFEMYRSPAHTASSSGSAQKRSPDSLTPGLSPRKIAPSEGLLGIENLRLSDEPSKISSDAAGKATGSTMQTKVFNSLAQSIHAGPSLGSIYPERPKATGTRPSQTKAYQASFGASSSASAPQHVSGAWTATPASVTEQLSPSPAPRGPPSGPFNFIAGGQASQATPAAAGREPAPKFPPGLGSFDLDSRTTGVEAALASSETRQPSGPKIIGVRPWEPKTTGPKIIGPPPYDPQRSVSTGPKIVGPAPFEPRIHESSGSQNIGIPSYVPKSREPTGPKIIGPLPFMPNYPVVRPSIDTPPPDTSQATSPQTPGTTSSAQSHQGKRSVTIIGPKPWTPSATSFAQTKQPKPAVTIIGPKPWTPGTNIFGRPTTNEPLSSSSSNVPKTTSTAASPASNPGSTYRPSPLSRSLNDSVWASTPAREQRSVSQASSRQSDTSASIQATQTENKAPPRVRIIGPQPWMPKD